MEEIIVILEKERFINYSLKHFSMVTLSKHYQQNSAPKIVSTLVFQFCFENYLLQPKIKVVDR